MEVEKHLERMIEVGRVPQALMFVGGVDEVYGAAVRFAGKLVGDEWGRVGRGNHPDVSVYRPEGKVGMHSVGVLRQFGGEVYMPPLEGKRRAFIFVDVERMMPVAANALLKPFEEPLGTSIVILLTSRPHRLLPTIRSRCQIVYFPRPSSIGTQHPALIRILGRPWEYGELLREVKAFVGQLEEGIGVWEGIMEDILGWYRDLELLRTGGDRALLHHFAHEESLEQVYLAGNFPVLQDVLPLIERASISLSRSTPLTSVLEALLLQLLVPPTPVPSSIPTPVPGTQVAS